MGITCGRDRLLAFSIALLAAGAGCETEQWPSSVGPSPFAGPPVTVSGIVTSGGQPVDDALVIGFRTEGIVDEGFWPNARTGPDGRFQYADVRPGPGVAILYPLKRDYLHPCLATIRVSKGVDLEFVKPPALRPVHTAPQVLTGTVTDQSGKPVGDAFVTGWMLMDFPVLQTRTDGKGRYLLCGLGEEFLRDGLITVGGVISAGYEAIHAFTQHGRPTALGGGEFVLDLQLHQKDQ